MVAWGSGGVGDGEVTAKGRSVSFWGDERDPKLTVVIVAHIYQNAKNHGIIHLKWRKSMVQELPQRGC